MDALTEPSGRSYTPLPIDGTQGLPQEFPVLFADRIYHFRLHVNALPALLEDRTAILELPAPEAFLVVRVEVESPDASRRTIFLRKVIRELEYQAEAIALTFPQQRVAVGNLNGRGEFGTRLSGGIAARWA